MSQTVFFVAMEGSVTERKYFDALIKKHNLRNVRLLKRPKTHSSPLAVLKRLEQEMTKRKDDYGVALNEEYWAVIDTDGRSTDILRKVATRATKKKISLAASNPCFELWLLLHFRTLDQSRGLEGSAATGGCDGVIDYLKRRFDNSYDKVRFKPDSYIRLVETAISNAKNSDSEVKDSWMQSVGSRVYKLAQSILDSSPNYPSN